MDKLAREFDADVQKQQQLAREQHRTRQRANSEATEVPDSSDTPTETFDEDIEMNGIHFNTVKFFHRRNGTRFPPLLHPANACKQLISALYTARIPYAMMLTLPSLLNFMLLLLTLIIIRQAKVGHRRKPSTLPFYVISRQEESQASRGRNHQVKVCPPSQCRQGISCQIESPTLERGPAISYLVGTESSPFPERCTR